MTEHPALPVNNRKQPTQTAVPQLLKNTPLLNQLKRSARQELTDAAGSHAQQQVQPGHTELQTLGDDRLSMAGQITPEALDVPVSAGSELSPAAQVYRVSTQFSPYPAGRFRRQGPYTGEALRGALYPLATQGPLTVDLGGLRGMPDSFAEEAFGGLIRQATVLGTLEAVLMNLHVIGDHEDVDTCRRFIRDAQARSTQAGATQAGANQTSVTQEFP